jgi:transcriptional regulator with XRE-family HTH domain
MNLARAIRILRAASGMSQRQLSEKLGTHESHVSRMEGGSRGANFDRACQIAKVFGVGVEVLQAMAGSELPKADVCQQIVEMLMRAERATLPSEVEDPEARTA